MMGQEGAARPWTRARMGVCGVFFVGGVVLASWVPFIPVVQRRLAMSEADLGAVLFAMTAGALTAVLGSGRLIARFGSRAVTGWAGVMFCLLLPAPVYAPDRMALAAALFFFGAAFGAMDVAMNAQAAEVQTLAGKPLMSGFHGLYSLGGLAGATVTGTLLSLQANPGLQTGMVVVTMLALCLASSRMLLPSRAGEAGLEGISLPPGPLVGLSLLAFVVFVGEGAVIDWAGVFLVDHLRVEPGVAASGFAAFSLAMAIGRLTGDRATARLGFVRFSVISALLAGGGLALALASTNLLVAIVGFAVAGIGFANLVPILFSQAARATPDAPQRGIAGVAGIGYLGLVAGPPGIGFVAEQLGLPFALSAVAVSTLASALVLPAAFARAARLRAEGAVRNGGGATAAVETPSRTSD